MTIMRSLAISLLLLCNCKPSKQERCDDAVMHLRVASMKARVGETDAKLLHAACMKSWPPALYDCLLAAKDDAAISACESKAF